MTTVSPPSSPPPVPQRTGPVTHAFSRLPVTVAPDRSLLTYDLLTSLLLGPFFFFVFLPAYFRWRSLRYEVDAEGITMRWGILFRREVSLTYERIQDIHLTSNLVERWLGLATIKVQTASGSADAEMTVQGLRDPEAIRDFFYERMRGAKAPAAPRSETPSHPAPATPPDELAATLREIALDVRAVRDALAGRMGTGGHDA